MAHAGDHYRALGVSPRATTAEIRHAYRRLARQHHPDRNPRPDGPERFRTLAEAYAVLTDPVRRADYDHRMQRPVRRDLARPTAAVPIRRGVLELSAREARLAATTTLTLTFPTADAMTIVLPAGLADGDQITIATPEGRAVLTVRGAVTRKI